MLADDAEQVRRIAEVTAAWTAYPRVLQVGWVDGHLEVSGTVQLSDVTPVDQTCPDDVPAAPSAPADAKVPNADKATNDRSEGSIVVAAEGDPVEHAAATCAAMPDEPLAEKRFAGVLGEPAPEVLWAGLLTSTIQLDLTERGTGESWQVSAMLHRMGLAASFSAAIDPNTLAAGARLADGLWDLNVQFGVLGLADRRRATLTRERQPGPVLPEPVADGPPTVAAYFTQQISGLCLDVGLVKHPKLRARPKSAAQSLPLDGSVAPVKPRPQKTRQFARRVVRKLRRMRGR
jgi:hypothetical protein